MVSLAPCCTGTGLGYMSMRLRLTYGRSVKVQLTVRVKPCFCSACIPEGLAQLHESTVADTYLEAL